jgi:hypothetical protein
MKVSERKWVQPVFLFIIVLMAYLSNGREIGTYDAYPAKFLPFSMVRYGNLYLDQLKTLRTKDGNLHYCFAESRGHILSTFPVAPALFSLPIEFPVILVLDRLHPGWNQDKLLSKMAKASAATITALSILVLFQLFQFLRFEKVALIAAFATALGSNMWMTCSQSLWQHGPATLSLSTCLYLLLSARDRPLRFFWAGLAAGAMVACRLTDIIFALAILSWIVCTQPKRLVWFLFGLAGPCIALATYNVYFFGGDGVRRAIPQVGGGGPRLRRGVSCCVLPPLR